MQYLMLRATHPEVMSQIWVTMNFIELEFGVLS